MNKAITSFYSKLIFLKIKNTKIYLYIKINFKKLVVEKIINEYIFNIFSDFEKTGRLSHGHPFGRPISPVPPQEQIPTENERLTLLFFRKNILTKPHAGQPARCRRLWAADLIEITEASDGRQLEAVGAR